MKTKPNRKDLHRLLREFLTFNSTQSEPTGYLNKSEMIELLVYIKFLRMQNQNDQNIQTTRVQKTK